MSELISLGLAASARVLEAIAAQLGPRSAVEFAAPSRVEMEQAGPISQCFPFEHDPMFAKQQG